MHALLLADSTERGTLRKRNGWIGKLPFEPVDWRLVPEEMEKFAGFLQSGKERVQAQQGMHAVELAALAHYFFVSKIFIS